MQTQQANELAEHLKGLITTMTDDQTLKVAEKLETFPHAAGKAAIDRYAELHEDFSLPKLIMILRDEKAKRAGTQPASKNVPYLQVLRSDAASMFPNKAEKIAAMPPAELILRIARGWWLKGSDTVPGENPEGQRRTVWPSRGAKISANAAQLLIEHCKMEPGLANGLANDVTADEITYQAALGSVMVQPELLQL